MSSGTIDSRLSASGSMTGATGRQTLATQFARYLVVGGAAFLADFFILWLASKVLGVHHLAAAALGFMVGMAVNYVLSIAWVFERRAVSDARLEFLLFLLVGVVGLGLTEAVFWGLVDGMTLPWQMAKCVTTGLVLVWNFSARKALLF